jgi:DNA-binding beta-propeller fold protein YncE
MTVHLEGLNEPYGVAVASDGSIIVAEGAEGRVLQIDGSEIKVAARGLSRPTGVATASDGSCYAAEAEKGRVVRLNGDAQTVLADLTEPHGVLVLGDELIVLDAGARELIGFSLRSRRRETIASNLPVGAPPGITPQLLMGVPGLLPGPLRPFAGLAADSSGTVYVAADGEGSILALSRS